MSIKDSDVTTFFFRRARFMKRHYDTLERIYQEIKRVVLLRQHPITGLLPASTAITSHGDYTDAWVRDNVYSIVCVWSLGMALRRAGQQERADYAEQATIKLMRGLLQAMMRQAGKVERFKHSLNPADALHAKYDTDTGLAVVADDAWGHLQIDATSLYLLMLAQMSASGLRIVCTSSEVDFVQNLVYYISSAYRTPDFGIWERGNKINNGQAEINASSVGMAKAALQALDGLNLFGANASKRGVIHVIADAVSLSRNTLGALLPRESLSKEVDSALLSIIGFPAFAVGSSEIITKTRDAILSKLGGNYGCKRFLWDGHQTVIEESSRLYYEHSELANFEHIESEWPLFYTYLYLNALFDGLQTTAKHYRQKIESLMIKKNGLGLIPELYYLPQENVSAEKKQPHSQVRLPNENIPLVWAQSLYYTGLLLDHDYIAPQDLDPLSLRQRSTRFARTQIALVVLAEDSDVKKQLSSHGVITEALDDIKPIGVLTAPHLVEVYTHVGANAALELTGRPPRRLQSLTSSHTYRINNNLFLCLSWLQSEGSDYRLYDGEFLSQMLIEEITHIRKHWVEQEVAVFTLLVRADMATIPGADTLFSTLKQLQLRTTHEHVGNASASLALRASRTMRLMVPELEVLSLKAAHTPVMENLPFPAETLVAPAAALVTTRNSSCAELQKLMLTLTGEFRQGDTIDHEGKLSLGAFLETLYAYARQHNHWALARLCFMHLHENHHDLSDSLILLAARHLVIVMGSGGDRDFTISSELSRQEIIAGIEGVFDDPLERVLAQEIIIAIGSLLRTQPALFEGLRSISLHNFMLLCSELDEPNDNLTPIQWLATQPPGYLYQRLRRVFSDQRKVFKQGMDYQSPAHWGEDVLPGVNAVDTDWFEWRQLRGLVPRFDDDFLAAIWRSLAHAPRLVFGDIQSEDTLLDCDLIRSSMTPGEESFAQLIDQQVQLLHPSYYKSAVIEALYGFTRYTRHHPQRYFPDTVIFSHCLEHAASRWQAENPGQDCSQRLLDSLLEQPPQVLQKYLEDEFNAISAERHKS